MRVTLDNIFETVSLEIEELSFWMIIADVSEHRGKVSLGISSEHLFGVCPEGKDEFPKIDLWTFDSIEEAMDHLNFYLRKAFPSEAKAVVEKMENYFNELMKGKSC